MAIEWDVYLGTTGATGKLSSFGRKVTINTNETVRESRTANGTLKQDILYTKKEFKINYTNITQSALDTLEYWYDYYKTNKTALPLYMYNSPGSYDEYSVIPKPLSHTRLVKGVDNVLSGVTLTLIEV